MATHKMIDVSQFNGVIDWAKVKDNVDMAVIRCGYRGYGAAGTLKEDPMFRRNITAALAAGIPVGVYWCSQAISDNEATEEAVYCKKLLEGYKLTLPVFLDSEHMGPGGIGRADKIGRILRTRYGLAFLRTMRAYGYKTGLYCAESWYDAEINGQLIKEDGHDVWIAKYSTTAPKVDGYHAWQYTSSGKVQGVSGDVDLSNVYKNYLGTDKPQDYREAVQHRFGLDDYTMDFMGMYKYGEELLQKLATRG